MTATLEHIQQKKPPYWQVILKQQAENMKSLRGEQSEGEEPSRPQTETNGAGLD